MTMNEDVLSSERDHWRARIELALAALAKISVHLEITEDRLLREEIDDALNGYLIACGLWDQERLLEKIADFREQTKPAGG